VRELRQVIDEGLRPPSTLRGRQYLPCFLHATMSTRFLLHDPLKQERVARPPIEDRIRAAGGGAATNGEFPSWLGGVAAAVHGSLSVPLARLDSLNRGRPRALACAGPSADGGGLADPSMDAPPMRKDAPCFLRLAAGDARNGALPPRSKQLLTGGGQPVVREIDADRRRARVTEAIVRY